MKLVLIDPSRGPKPDYDLRIYPSGMARIMSAFAKREDITSERIDFATDDNGRAFAIFRDNGALKLQRNGGRGMQIGMKTALNQIPSLSTDENYSLRRIDERFDGHTVYEIEPFRSKAATNRCGG